MTPNNDKPFRSAAAAFRKQGGLLRMTDAIAAGIHRRTLYAMRDAGLLEQMSRGLYRLADTPALGNPDLVTVTTRIPHGVICLISALAFHELTTQIPHEVYVAVPRDSTHSRLVYPPIRLFKYSHDSMAQGVERYIIDGRRVPIFNKEKTLADCFKYRNKIGLDTAIEALKLYREKRPVHLNAILAFATVNRVANVIRPYLEALA